MSQATQPLIQQEISISFYKLRSQMRVVLDCVKSLIWNANNIEFTSIAVLTIISRSRILHLIPDLE